VKVPRKKEGRIFVRKRSLFPFHHQRQVEKKGENQGDVQGKEKRIVKKKKKREEKDENVNGGVIQLAWEKVENLIRLVHNRGQMRRRA